MRSSLNKRFLLITAVLLLVEVIIGVFVKDSFIKPFVGDVLSVCVIYAFIKIFYVGNSLLVGIGVLTFAFLIEIAQYFKLATTLGLTKGSIGYIILGATFDPIDFLAYSLGILGCLIFGRSSNV